MYFVTNAELVLLSYYRIVLKTFFDAALLPKHTCESALLNPVSP